MTWRRIFLLTSLILLLVLLGSWVVLQRTGAVAAFAHTALRQALAAPFELADAELAATEGTLTVRGFALRDPTRVGQHLVTVERALVAVTADPFGSLLALHAIDIDGVLLDVDLVQGLPRLDQLLRTDASAGNPGDGPSLLPVITVQRSRVRARVHAELPPFELQDLQLQLRPRQTDDGGVDRRHAELSGSALLVPLQLPLVLAGSVDLGTGATDLQVRVRDVPVAPTTLDLLRPALPAAAREVSASARIQELTAWLRIRQRSAGAPPELTFGGQADLAGLMVQGPPLPYALRDATLQLGVSSTGTGQLDATLEQRQGDGRLHVAARVTDLSTTPQIEVRGTGERVPIDESVRTALQSFAVGRAVVDGLQPTAGLADLQLFLRNPGGDDEIVDVDLELQGVALSYHGFGHPERRVAFPLPVVDARGRVHVRQDVIAIENVRARLAPAAGGGEITMHGRVQPRRVGDDIVTIDLDCTGMQFTPALRAAMARLLRDDGALWDQFAPRGGADVTLRVRSGQQQPSDWNVQVRPRAAEFGWTRFPWPVRGVDGVITAQDQGLEFDLRARHGEASLRAQGRLLAPPDRPGAITDGRIELRVDATNVALDSELRLATTTLAPGLDRAWEDLQPTGTTGASATVCRPDGNADLGWELRLDLERVDVTPAFLPMPVHGLHGPVFVTAAETGLRIDLEALRGQVPQGERAAEIALVGTVRTEPRDENITAVVRQLQLDSELAHALERIGALTPATWNTLRPAGTVDVTCHHLRPPAAPATQRLTVWLREVTSDAPMLPRRATQVTGELEIADGVVTFEQVRARIGDAPITCVRGHVRPAEGGATEVAFTIAAEHFPASDDLARLFTGPLHQAVLERQLRGFLRIHELELRFLLPPDGSDQPFSTTLRGRLEAKDVDVLLGTRLEGIQAWIEIDESTIDSRGGALRGTIARASMRLLGQPWNALQARFQADAQRLLLHDLRSELHGGTVAGHDANAPAVEYLLASATEPDGRLALDLDFERVRLHDFLTACGLVGTPYRGVLGGRLHLLALRGGDLVNMHAEGQLAVTDGDLGTVPLFTAIYALMAEANRPRFHGLSSKFTLRDRVLRLDDVAVTSPLIAVTGSGTMTMEGYLDVAVTLDSLFGGSADLLLLPPVIQMITSRLVRFHLFGHLRDLRAEQRWFAERDPHRPDLAPVPLRPERPVRPGF